MSLTWFQNAKILWAKHSVPTLYNHTLTTPSLIYFQVKYFSPWKSLIFSPYLRFNCDFRDSVLLFMVKVHFITKGGSHSFCFKSCWNKRATHTHTHIELTIYSQVDKPNGWFYWWNNTIQINKATLTELELNYTLSLSSSWGWCVTFWAEGVTTSEHILVWLCPFIACVLGFSFLPGRSYTGNPPQMEKNGRKAKMI